jgi:hypothetical protein
MIWQNKKFALIIFILIFISISHGVSYEAHAQISDSTLYKLSSEGMMNHNLLDLKEILLDSHPQDANVFYNDSLIGSTPIFISSEMKNLTLKKSGYENYNLAIDKISPGEKISLNFNGFQREESFFERDIFKILTAGIIVFGGTTAYFKLKADKKFDEYEFTGESKYLDETRKYDLISGITFGALQINFGLLLYYFLTE